LKETIKHIRLTYLNVGIHSALDYYLDTLPFPFELFQIMDLHMFIDNPESAAIRSRRGGKSRDLSVIGVFLALLEYKVIWRAPYSDQLKQAALYLQHNPFVKRIALASRNEVDVFFSPSMEVGSLTVGKTASLGCDALIYDEGGKVEKDKLMYQNYLYSRAMIAASMRPKFIIHGTTPAIYTAIEETVDGLPDKAVSIHPYTDMHWISDDFVVDEQKKHMHDPWYIDQEYRCMFVVRGGAVFDNIKTYQELGLSKPTFYNRMGIDFNGAIGHMVVRTQMNEQYILCAPDLVVHDLDEIPKYIEKHMEVEIEDGGYNAGFVKHAPFQYQKRLVNDTFSSTRLHELKSRTIVVDEVDNYQLIKNLRESMYDERKPIIKKRNDQHYLDGLLHSAISLTGSYTWTPPRRSEILKNQRKRERYR